MTREIRILLLLLAAFLLVNGLTLSRYPSVWVDEVQFADPAVSLASGEGFTSTAWFAQHSTQFWAGNVPLYSGLLSVWLRVFGISILAERSLNLVIFAAVVLLIWRWMRNSQTVTSLTWRLIAVTLLLCGHAMVFSYRSGRYDALGMVLAALVLNLWQRPLWLVPVGLLIPFAGLQLIPAGLVLGVIVSVFGGRPAAIRAATLTAGIGIGAVCLRSFYMLNGAWEGFRASTSAIGQMRQSIVEKLLSLPSDYVTDKSRVLVAIALLILLWSGRSMLQSATRRIAGFAIAALILLPAALHMAGKFPIYYGWMVFIPLVIALAHSAERLPVARYSVGALIVLAALAGLPLRMLGAVSNFSQRDPARVEAFVRQAVPQNTTVVADFKTYYALRSAGIRPLLPTYLHALTAAERESVETLLLRPEDVASARKELGGQWVATEIVLSAPAPPTLLKKLVAELREENFEIRVYRRIASAPTLASLQDNR